MKYIIINPDTQLYWDGFNWGSMEQARVYSNRTTTLPENGLWQEVVSKYPWYQTVDRFDVV